MEPAILAIISVVAGSASVITYRFIKRRNQRLLREALRKKYAPDLPGLKNHDTTTVVHSETEKIGGSVDKKDEIPPVVRTKQIEELTEKDYNDWETRDDSRNENIVELRLILEELLDEMPPSDEEFDDDERIMELGVRETWIEENDEELEEHATFVERENVGSGIIVEDSPPENDDLDHRLEREGGKSGSVQVSLAWDDYNDLDLHLFCPSGERIYFNNRNSECGGELDVDMNVKPVSKTPVENVVWTSNPPKGAYKVGVHFYKHHRKRKTKKSCKFRVRVSLYGKIQEYSGVIKYGNAMQMVTGFTIGNQDELSKKYQNHAL
ncbi:MAG: YfaP family protein [Candidatus Poseidoniaceae archaeon]|nr:hypothetical protein [Euryarchaeota archaeon]|tara:strand:+ start:3686 stop:4654 length:969 start_codon:yes stop_codon:yes gene_type:complete